VNNIIDYQSIIEKMGNEVSATAKNTVEMGVSVTVKKSMKTIANCSTQAAATQNINVGGIKIVGDDQDLSLSQNMKSTLNMSCVLKSNVVDEVKNNLESDIKQAAEATGENMGGWFGGAGNTTTTNSETMTKIKQDILTDINMDQIMNQIGKNTGNQIIDVGGIDITGNRNKIAISQDITMETFSTAMTDVIMRSITDNVVKNKIDTSAKATSSSGFMDFKSLIMLIIFIVIVAGVIFGAYKLYKNSQNDDEGEEKPRKKNKGNRRNDGDDSDSDDDEDGDDREQSYEAPQQSYGQSPPSYGAPTGQSPMSFTFQINAPK